MKNILVILSVISLCFGSVTAWCVGGDLYAQETPDDSGYLPFSPDELDELLAPVALYPDPLLAQLLPAATFIDQIDEATRYVRQYGKTADIDDQPWDVSVKAVAHYTDVLFMMDQKYDWTVSVGDAFVNQEQDVMDSIQRLRSEALSHGNLVTTPQQEVSVADDGTISIVPAMPALIFVPFYDLDVFYQEPSPVYGFITYSIGLPIGVWLNRDCDWHRHRVFYHGWRGGGWIGKARPHLRIRNPVYVNNRFAVVKVNKQVARRVTDAYREELRRKAGNIHQTVVRPGSPSPAAKRPPPGEPGVEPARSRPVVPPERREAPVGNTDLYRGRDVRKSQPASRTGYGGYGSGREAIQYHERGKASRETIRQMPRPSLPPAPPVVRPSSPPARGGGGGAVHPR